MTQQPAPQDPQDVLAALAAAGLQQAYPNLTTQFEAASLCFIPDSSPGQVQAAAMIARYRARQGQDPAWYITIRQGQYTIIGLGPG